MTATARLRFSAGTGPAECALAVGHAVERCRNEASGHGVTVSTVESNTGPVPHSFTWCNLELRGPDDAVEALSRRWLGTVQWCCPSPLRPHHRRKNWFVDVRAVDEQGVEVADLVADADIDVVAIRAGGPGGQHRNKVATGIRLTHRPTGITVEATEARSQTENRRRAQERLLQRLEEIRHDHQQARQHTDWSANRDLQRGDAGLRFDGPGFIERPS